MKIIVNRHADLVKYVETKQEIAALDAKIAAIKIRIKRLKKKLEGEKC